MASPADLIYDYRQALRKVYGDLCATESEIRQSHGHYYVTLYRDGRFQMGETHFRKYEFELAIVRLLERATALQTKSNGES